MCQKNATTPCRTNLTASKFYLLPCEDSPIEPSLSFYQKRTPSQGNKLSPTSFRYKFIIWIGKSNKYAPYIFSTSLVLPVFFLPPITKPFGLFTLAVSVFVLTLYPWRGGKKESGMAHALIFFSIFALLLLYLFNPNHPTWMNLYLSCISILSLVWVICRVVYKRRYQVILPTSFELLLIVISWFIPLLWGQMLDLNMNIQQYLIITCILSIPILAGAKAMMRRQARRNTKLVACLQMALILLGIKAFW